MEQPQLFPCNLAIQPDLAHREDFGVEVDVVHVPDDDRQKGEQGLVAVGHDENIVDPEGEEAEGKLDIPHEKPANNHHQRAPADRPVFEFLDKVITAEKRRALEEPVWVSIEKIFQNS